MNKINKKVLVLLTVVLVIVAVGFIYNAVRPKHNEFVRVGDMHYARSGHKAVLLQDGRVLIAGVEIYEPEKRKFKLIEMAQRASGETMTVLNNGLVLIIRASGKTVLFDPKSETSKYSSSLNYPRRNYTATLLKDGQVLIIGGQLIDPSKDYNHQVLKYAEYSEIYNPITEKFEIGSKINVPRSEHESILLDNGNVLVIGGEGEHKRLNSAEIYDVKLNKFVKISNMNSIRVKPQLIKLKNGNILVIGGYANSPIENKSCTKNTCGWQETIEIYNPEKKEFNEFIQNKLTSPTSKATLLKNGNVLFTAGSKSERWYVVDTRDSAILNTEKKRLIKGPDLKRKRDSHTATLLDDGTVLITGGWLPNGVEKSAELYYQ